MPPTAFDDDGPGRSPALGSPALGAPAPAPPATASAAWGWVFLALAGFAAGQVAAGILVSVAASVSHEHIPLTTLLSESTPPWWVTVTSLVGVWLGFVGAVVLAAYASGTRSVVADMRLRFGRRAPQGGTLRRARSVCFDVALGAVVGVFGQYVLVNLLYLPFEQGNPNLGKRLGQPTQKLTGGFHGASLVWIGVLTVVVVPLVEELFFRGLVLRAMLRIFARAGRVVGPALGTVVTGVLFGLAHAEWLQLAGLAAFGIVLSLMAWRLDRLGPCICAHAAFNLVAVLSVAAGR